jgi:hypothetical protein
MAQVDNGMVDADSGGFCNLTGSTLLSLTGSLTEHAECGVTSESDCFASHYSAHGPFWRFLSAIHPGCISAQQSAEVALLSCAKLSPAVLCLKQDGYSSTSFFISVLVCAQ